MYLTNTQRSAMLNESFEVPPDYDKPLDPARQLTLLCTGSRDWRDWDAIDKQLRRFYYYCDTQRYCPRVIVGDARGVDTFIARWHRERLMHPSLTVYEADWATFGKSAGPRRNAQMVLDGQPDYAIAFWDSQSRGTANCIALCRDAGVPIRVITSA